MVIHDAWLIRHRRHCCRTTYAVQLKTMFCSISSGATMLDGVSTIWTKQKLHCQHRALGVIAVLNCLRSGNSSSQWGDAMIFKNDFCTWLQQRNAQRRCLINRIFCNQWIFDSSSCLQVRVLLEFFVSYEQRPSYLQNAVKCVHCNQTHDKLSSSNLQPSVIVSLLQSVLSTFAPTGDWLSFFQTNQT